MDIRIVGVNGDVVTTHGVGTAADGIWLAEAGLQHGLWRMPTETEWTSARRERGARHIGTTIPSADITLGFHVVGDSIFEVEDRLDALFSFGLDPWDADARLARVEVETVDGVRWREVQRLEAPELMLEGDAEDQGYIGAVESLRAGSPAWRSADFVTEWETGSSSGAGAVEVWNPTPLPMFHTWVLTPGVWVLPDVSWVGSKGRRSPGGEFGGRSVTVTVTSAHGGARVNLDPMRLMIEALDGSNILGAAAGGYFFMHEIPPHTPRTTLPVSVSGASGGARVELHQPRHWTKPWGGY